MKRKRERDKRDTKVLIFLIYLISIYYNYWLPLGTERTKVLFTVNTQIKTTPARTFSLSRALSLSIALITGQRGFFSLSQLHHGSPSSVSHFNELPLRMML